MNKDQPNITKIEYCCIEGPRLINEALWLAVSIQFGYWISINSYETIGIVPMATSN